MKSSILRISFQFLFFLMLALPASALEALKGEAILEVSGEISVFNTADGKAQFDQAALNKYATTTVITETPWTNGLVTFEGVLVRDILASLKHKGSQVAATAINDYTVKIPIKDFDDYNVILAYKMNGKVMNIRDKGPLWLIYPWTENPELKTELYHSRSIWQLKLLTVK